MQLTTEQPNNCIGILLVDKMQNWTPIGGHKSTKASIDGQNAQCYQLMKMHHRTHSVAGGPSDCVVMEMEVIVYLSES